MLLKDVEIIHKIVLELNERIVTSKCIVQIRRVLLL